MTPAPIATLLSDRRAGTAAAVLLTLPYWSSGILKLADWRGSLAEARRFDLEPAIVVVMLMILVQLGGSLLVITGRLAWFALAPSVRDGVPEHLTAVILNAMRHLD